MLRRILMAQYYTGGRREVYRWIGDSCAEKDFNGLVAISLYGPTQAPKGDMVKGVGVGLGRGGWLHGEGGGGWG